VETAQPMRVVVVGAGLSGLAAAWRLMKQGCEVTLLEGSQRVGGRAIAETVDGFSVDGMLPLIRSCDATLIDWIYEIEMEESLLPARPLILAQVHRKRLQPIDTASLGGLAAIPGVSFWDKKRLLRLPRLMDRYRPVLDPQRPERAASLDYRSAADFGRLYFGKTLWEQWVSPETLAAYGGSEADVSRVAFLLERIACNDGTAGLGALRRSLQDLAVQVAARLGVHLGAKVVTIEPGEHTGYVVQCTVEGMPEGTTRAVEADAVVLTTSPREARVIADDVITLGERDFFDQVQTAPSTMMSIGLERSAASGSRIVRVPHTEALPIDTFLYEEGRRNDRVPEGQALITLVANRDFSEANQHAADEVIEKSLVSALIRVLPGVAGSIAFTRLTRRANSTPLFHVGAYRALDRFQSIQRDRRASGRRLYFAGDYLAGPSAENAASAGRRAADALLEDIDG
jgi:oxygen-dependent protoporphyrinogen oxidase